MTDTLIFNQRDLDFLLFEHLNLQQLQQSERFADFGLEDYSMILAESAKFCVGELGELNSISDRVGSRYVDGAVQVPPEYKTAWGATIDNGWFAPTMPEQYGGMALPGTMGVAIEEMQLAACTPFYLTIGLTMGVADMLLSFGTEEQKARFVEPLIKGRWAGTMVLTEPGAGSALGDIRSTATPIEGTDTWLIEGTKIFITSGDHDITENIIHAVLARIPNGPGGTKDLGLFLVPKFWVNEDGSMGEANDVACTGIERKMGLHGSPTSSLAFGEQGICRGFLLGGVPFQGMRMMFQMMNEARIKTGLQGVALASLAYQNALRYTKERAQGGAIETMGKGPSVPIIQHGDVRRMLLLQKSHVEGMRALAYYAALLQDRAEVAGTPELAKELESRMALLTPLVKAYCSDKGFEMCSEAIQCYGGYGYTSDYPAEQFTRDVRIAPLYEGTNFIQSADLVGRKIPRNQLAFMVLMTEIETWADAQADNEEIAIIAKRVGAARNALMMATGELMQCAQSGDVAFPFTVSTRYLHMFAEVMVGYLLGQQALIAADALANKDLSDSDRTFYQGRIITSRFFANNILPGVRMKAAVIKNHDTSSLDMPEAAF